MKYRHRFQVRAPVVAVGEFHSQPGSMAAITPPPVAVRIHRAPDRLREGDEMDFTLSLGPLSIRWQARLEDVSASGFIDRQISGPFRRWIHRHSFLEEGPERTAVIDEIEASLRLHPVWGPVGLGLWLSLPILFAFRSWKTRRCLEGWS